MKKTLFLIIFISISIFNIKAQENYFYINTTRYISTTKSQFGTISDFGQEKEVDILFAKNGNAGMIVITVSNSSSNEHILGNLLIYLKDGTVIQCIDRHIYDNVNDEATTVYYLTSIEINEMKNSNIDRIRFSIGDTYYKQNYSVSNGYSYTTYDYSQYSYKTNYYECEVPILLNGIF